jgi:glycosyltransferase involved in cell wall biosynthesis
MAERPSLHIGVDGRELVGQPTGVGRYLGALLRLWADDPSMPHRFTVFAPQPPAPALARLGERGRWTVVGGRHAGTWWEQTELPRAVRASGANVFFAAGYTAPLRLTCPFVLAVYDVSFFAHPEWFTWREGMRRRWLTRASARRARSVITISEFSASEIARYLGIPPDKIRLAPPGPPTGLPARSGDEHRSPLILFVGSLFARRRIPELLQAFARVAARVPDARLTLVGDNRTVPRIDPRALADQLGVGARTTWLEYVDEAELHRLYSSAHLFVFLSEYEGFALTPYEAIARGTPAVLLDTPAAREVYGDAARLVPLDPAAIADAMTTLLADRGAHAALLAAGRRRLAQLSWAESAATVRAALEDAAGRP